MFVSKKKYQAALEEILDLKKKLDANENKLNLKEESEVMLQKEYDMVLKQYDELKSELEELNPLNISLTILKSQEEALVLEISSKTNLLDSLYKKIKESEINKINLKNEVQKLKEEFEKLGKDRFINSSIVERELHQKLLDQLEIQKIQINEHTIT